MTLTETLQIKEHYLQFEDLRALDYCEERWRQDGRPATRWEMINFIERMLQELQQNGIGYPRVLLLRKKEIQRRTFTLELRQESDTPGGPQIAAGDACLECEGRGFVLLPGGGGTLCRPCMGRGRKITVTSEMAGAGDIAK
jgi:hypothetical protein